MIDLGKVKPGSTIRVPFSSFDKDDGSSITMTNYAAADILVYKDGGTTERASTAGYTATTDFDAKTGKHVAVIDLADNTTAGFFAAGSEYIVAIDAVTVDAVTTGGWIARFRIGYEGAMLDTTIATLASQTSFTLTAGPAEDDALNDQWVIIHDVASAVQCGKAIISDYTGSTKTVTLAAGTTFTAAATDNVSIMGPMPMQPATAARKPVVDAAGLVDANMVKAGPTGSGTAQTAKDIGAAVPAAAPGASGGLLISGSNGGTTTFGALTVTGATTLTGAVSMGSTFTITGATTLAALSCTTITASGAVAFQSTFGVTGTMTVNAFTCTNNFTVSGNWLTTGTTTWTGAATFTAGLTTNITGTASGNATAAQGANLDAAISSRMATYTQPTGFLAATFPSDPADQSIIIAATDAIVAAVGTRASQTSVDDLPTNAELATALGAADDAVLAAIAALNNLSSAGATSAVTTALTTALTEAYRATGATGSVAQLLYELVAHMGNSRISSTTKTLEKLDKTTTAKTFTLDSATTPTAIEETT